MKNIMKKSLVALFAIGLAYPAFADVAVVVHPSNTSKLDETQVRNIYLGKVKLFGNGTAVYPIDIKPGDAARQEFVSKLLRKSEANLNAYWARMLFSSKGKPPAEVADSAAVLAAVASNKSAIGYVDASKVDNSVKVLMVIK